MPDYSIIEIALITGGADAIREHEQPGDYEVSVLIDYAPLPGDLFRRVRALVRDRRLAAFPVSLVAKDEVDAYPLLGTVRGVSRALANNQHFGGGGGLPTGLRLEEALNLPNLYANAPRIHPPKLPTGQPVGVGGPTDPKTHVRPDAPYAAYQPFDGGPVRDGQAIGADGTLFELPKDPIERFLDVLTPMIEKMAEMAAIPVQVQLVGEEAPKWVSELTGGVPLRPTDFSVSMPEPEEFLKKEGPFAREYRRHFGEAAVGRNKCEVKKVVKPTPRSLMGLETRQENGVATERRVILDLLDDEFRELLVWHFRQALEAHVFAEKGRRIIRVKDIERIADDAFRRIFGEIRNEVVITGRDVGVAP